jgi:hypothetical protein
VTAAIIEAMRANSKYFIQIFILFDREFCFNLFCFVLTKYI